MYDRKGRVKKIFSYQIQTGHVYLTIHDLIDVTFPLTECIFPYV